MIEVRGASKVFPAQGTPTVGLRQVDLVVAEGEFLAVVGPAGSGKSTLLSLIGCLDVPSQGDVLFRGTSTASLKDDELSRLRLTSIGFIFPKHNLIDELTVRENVELPLIYMGARKRHERSDPLLSDVGLTDRAEERAGRLQDADRLRAALARSLVNDPALIIADEPTSCVDRATAHRLLGTLHELSRQGRTIVLATDDENVADAARRVVRISDGALRSIAPSSEPAMAEAAAPAPASRLGT